MYQGGSYMCFGHVASGRGLVGMLFLQKGEELGERGLFFSPGRPQDWMIQAGAVNFDLDSARKQGKIRIVWIPASAPGGASSDEAAAQALQDLVQLIVREQPHRVLINDFMPFLQFGSLDYFQQMFRWMLKELENTEATLMFMMPDVVNAKSQQIIEFMKDQMAGSIHVSLNQHPGQHHMPGTNGFGDGAPGSRRLTLWPGLGHVEHEVLDSWVPEVPDMPNVSGLSNTERRGRGSNVIADTSNPPRGAAKRERKPAQAKPFDFGTASFGDSGPAIGTPLSTMAINSLRDVESQHQVFLDKLALSFKQRATKKYKPFLLVALRMESDTDAPGGPIGLDMLLPAIEKIVDPEDILADVSRRRIIAFLPNKREEDVQDFFASIQEKLREEYPQVADQLPHVVSAVVVPNGQPFDNPKNFLAYALEGN